MPIDDSLANLTTQGATDNGDAQTLGSAGFQQLAGNAASQAVGQYGQGQAALKTQAPQVYNPAGQQSRQQLQGTQNAYGALNATLQGPLLNVGQAMTQAGTDQSIAAQMTAANSGRGGAGGYNLGSSVGAQNTAAQLQVASGGAGATQAQQSAAQGMYSSNLGAQGQAVLQQGQTQQQQALEAAQMQQKQRAMNIAQAQNLYGQSAQNQQQYQNAVNAYIQQAQAAQNLAVKQQNQNTSQESSVGGDILGAASDIIHFL